jgi:hypothetical protein
MVRMDFVSETQRKHNSQATAEMLRWRRDYNHLADAIRRSKARLRHDRRFSNASAEAAERMALRVLGAQAAAMMEKRRGIKTILRCTAYAYAPREIAA